jgi:hypothetical protein
MFFLYFVSGVKKVEKIIGKKMKKIVARCNSLERIFVKNYWSEVFCGP